MIGKFARILMNLDAIPLFAMLKGRLGYLGDREKVLSENIANASTPGFAPRDLKAFGFQAAMDEQKGGPSVMANGVATTAATGMTQTQAQHMSMVSRRSSAHGAKVLNGQNDSETTLDGNAVVLEEQMVKMTEARMDYDAAITFYQRSLGLLRTASRAPGK